MYGPHLKNDAISHNQLDTAVYAHIKKKIIGPFFYWVGRSAMLKINRPWPYCLYKMRGRTWETDSMLPNWVKLDLRYRGRGTRGCLGSGPSKDSNLPELFNFLM